MEISIFDFIGLYSLEIVLHHMYQQLFLLLFCFSSTSSSSIPILEFFGQNKRRLNKMKRLTIKMIILNFRKCENRTSQNFDGSPYKSLQTSLKHQYYL